MATTIKKDTAITPITVNKIRKKLRNHGLDPDNGIIYASFDRIAIDSNGNEAYIIDSNTIQIPQSRFSEPLVQAYFTALQNMIQNEF